MTTKRKPYVRPMTSTWWKKLPFYRFYMLREGTAVPAVWFSIELIFGLFALQTRRGILDGIRRLFTKPGSSDLKPHHPGGRAVAHQNLV
nr:fumarate reductase complex subunit C; membrane anchor polypeptide [Salmonella sp. NCTC 7297]